MDTSTPIMQPERKKMGRPSSYDSEIAHDLCEEIARGAALHRLCNDSDRFPAERTVYGWLEKEPAFQQMYARARERQQDYEADRILEIADNESDPNKARVMIDARKWRASKLAPKKYGDHISHDVSGSIQIEEVRRLIVEPAPRTIEGKLTTLAVEHSSDQERGE